MALGFYFTPSSFTPSGYDEVIEKLEAAGAGNPRGRLYHFALETEGKIQVFDVWDSEESFRTFGETLLPIMAEIGADPGTPMVSPVRNFIEGLKMNRAATLRRSYDLLNDGDVEGFMHMLADDFVEHEHTPGLPATKEGVEEFFRMYLAAFPDLRFSVESILASGDKVIARVQITGTQRGDFMGMPATGKEIRVDAIDIVSFGDDGLAHEHWGITDAFSMMQQLGFVREAVPVS